MATLSLLALHDIDMAAKKQTMKMIEDIKKMRLNVLIDLGSTHNFLDLAVAKQLGCPIQITDMQKVLVANGEKMDCTSMAKKFGWLMQEKNFEARVFLMPLKGCELILGIEWLNIMRVIKWDFPNLSMEFVWMGETIILKAENQEEAKWKEGEKLTLHNKVGLWMLSQECAH